MWVKRKCFWLKKREDNTYIIDLDQSELNIIHTKGNPIVICARLLGLSYAEFLRFCRDILGAKLEGKNTSYPIPYFTSQEMANELIKLLNNRANLVLWERANPGWEQHQERKE